MIGPAVIAQQPPREHHVVGGDRRAVGKVRRGIERECHVAARVVGFDGARQQAVERERLVVVARHQALDDVTAHRLHGEALHDEWIEAVESAEHALDDAAALRRIGIGIRQGDKILRHGRRAMHGDGISSRRRRRQAGERADQNLGAAERGPNCIAVGSQGFASARTR